MVLDYNDTGEVVSWGDENHTMLVDVNDGAGPRVESVSCWRLLYVIAYVRDYAGYSGPYHGDHGWEFFCDYWVSDWRLVEEVFDMFFGTAGLYHRVSFHVETRYWNHITGWSYNDQV